MPDDLTAQNPAGPAPGSLMPFDSDPYEGDETSRGLGFSYIGEAKTADEFSAYVTGYDFGTIPPDSVILHHSAIPGTLYAPPPGSGGAVWDAGEAGLSADSIKARRKVKLDGLRDYYQKTLLWGAGPHLYIDDRWIWLFTPMRELGIHAMWGNSMHDANNKLHYSIGIEVIGYYEHQPWPPEVAHLVGHAVAALKKRLGTFELTYMYPNGSPGMYTDADGKMHCQHPEQLKWGGIASHRDYNKPACPGAAITEHYYMGVLRDGWQQLNAPGH